MNKLGFFLTIFISLNSFSDDLLQTDCPNFDTASHWGISEVETPSDESIKVLLWITDMIAIHPNFRFCEATFSKSWTAFAAIYDGNRYIVYDRKTRFLDDKGIIRYDDLAVIAHEIAHHISGHTISIGNLSNFQEELEADRFAAFVLARLGASREQSYFWTNRFSKFDSDTHPARHKRKQAAIEGWTLAQTMKNREAQLSCKNEWIGELFDAGDTLCRTGWRCDYSPPQVQWACLDENGKWRWRKDK